MDLCHLCALVFQERLEFIPIRERAASDRFFKQNQQPGRTGVCKGTDLTAGMIAFQYAVYIR